MVEFTFKDEEGGFAKRSNKSLRLVLFVAILIAGFATLLHTWQAGLILAGIIFLVQHAKGKTQQKYFVHKITFSANDLSIHFSKEEEQEEITGRRSDFVFKKATAFSRSRIIYLAIYYKGVLLLKQFEISDWNESKMDAIIHQSKAELPAS